MKDETIGPPDYVQTWHDRHAGATATILGGLVDSQGRSSYQVLADALGPSPGPRLDLACGDGSLLELVGDDAPWLGIDLNPSELQAGRRRLGPTTPLLRAAAAQLPLATDAVGVVTCHFALMLLQPLEAVLAEMSRVLRPGGQLAVVLPGSADAPEPAIWQVFRDVWRMVTDSYPVEIPPLQDARVLDADQLAALASPAGLEVEEMTSFTVTRWMTTGEATQALLLTYLPDLLPPAGRDELVTRLGLALAELAGHDRRGVLFEEGASLLLARRVREVRA